MCYAIPGKVIEIDGKIATIDYFGEHRKVRNDFLETNVGDYIYAQGGIIIDKIDESDAVLILDFWKEEFFLLKEIDSRLSNVEVKTDKSSKILSIMQKVNLNQKLDYSDMMRIMETTDVNELKLIYTTANNLRFKENDNACCVHGIIEFSNHCIKNCFYCGIRKDMNISRYRMEAEEILYYATYAVNELGFKAIVLQSGEDTSFDDEKLIWIVKEMKKLNVLIFLSLGERSVLTYKKLYDAGARVILLRFETSNEKIFNTLRPGTSLRQRIDLIKHLKNIGYAIATGFLMGLPEEKNEDIINNLLLCKSSGCDMYSFGPLIPAKDTPLENQKKVDLQVVLKTIALARFLDRNAKILVTSALETLDGTAKKEGLMAGANSLMINITPNRYKHLYSIYPKKSGNDIDIKDNIQHTIDLLAKIGRAPTDLGM